MASFGHLSVQMLIKPFSNPDNLSKTVADLLPYGFIWKLFYADVDQAIFKPKYTFPNP